MRVYQLLVCFSIYRACAAAGRLDGTFYRKGSGISTISSTQYDPAPFNISELSSAAAASNSSDPTFIFVPGTEFDVRASWRNRYVHSECNVTFATSNLTTVWSPYIEVRIQVPLKGDNEECYVIDPFTYGSTQFFTDWNQTVILHFPASIGFVQLDIYCFNIVCFQGKTACSELINFLDDNYASPYNPMIVKATDRFEIKATMITETNCGTPTYTWRVIGVGDNETFSRINNYAVVDNVLVFYENVLSAGMYMIILEAETSTPFSTHYEDVIYVQVVLPDLMTIVNSASIEELPVNSEFYLSAGQSYDPAISTPDNREYPLDAYWHVLVSSTLADSDVYACVASFPNCNILTTDSINGTLTGLDVTYGGSNLRIKEADFASDVNWVFIIFRMNHNERYSSSLTVYHLNSQASRSYLYRCIYNCLSPVVGKTASGVAGFEVTPSFSTEHYNIQYNRTIREWDGTAFVNSSINLLGGQLSDYLSLTDEPLVSGQTYLLSLDIFVTPLPGINAQNWTLSIDVLKHVNYPPYDGSCTIDKTAGNASSTSYEVSCSGWKDEDERYERDSSLDSNPSLTYLVIQKYIEGGTDNETLVVSSDTAMSFVALTGDPNNGYQSLLIVQILDMFNEAATVEFTITSTPILDVTTITGDDDGAEIVRNFTRNINQTFYDFEPDVDMSIPVGKAAGQVLNSIAPPQSNTELPVTLDTPGIVMDLNINAGSSPSSLSFNHYINDLLNTTLDPATVAIRQSIELITNRINHVMTTRVLSGHKYLDQNYLDQMTQCFTALISVQSYVTDTTKVIAEQALAVLATASGSIWTTSQAQSEVQQITSKSQLVDMTGNIVGVVVPDNLNQARVVYDLSSALGQIDDIVELSGPNMNKAVEESSVSPTERAYLYLKSQQQLQAELTTAKRLARSTTQSIQNMTKDVLQSTDMCTGCSQLLGSGSMIQNVTILPMDSIDNVTVFANNAKLNMNLGKSNTGDSLAVAVTHFDKNIFMYDNDLSSSFVSYGVLHVELGDTAGISLDQVSYEQDVDHVDKELIIPFIVEDDVSKFSLHQFMYRSPTDEVCLNLEPASSSVIRFDGYLRFEEAPTILNYDVKFSISSDTNWVKCLGAALMQGHQGMVYLGLQIVEDSSVSRRKRDEQYVINLESYTEDQEDYLPTFEHSTSKAYQRYALSRRKRSSNATSSSNTTVTSQHSPYYMSVVTAACLNWQESQRAWKSDKCQMTWVPSDNKVQCVCQNVPQMTFGTSFFVAPQAIDFSSAFLRFSPKSQAAIIATIAVVGIIYALLLVWARRKDRNDMLKWGILPLADNYDDDTHCYLISVHTGLRLGAGTSSRVAFVLSGHRTDTGIREMRDGYRKDFPTGSVVQYLMTSQFHLGQLTHLRIWHDNSGQENMTSWYLSRVTVFDMRKKDTYNFLCERWISVETCEGDVLEVTLPATNPESEAFDYTFMTHAKRTLSDDHTWISFLYRPHYSNFTRTQRVTCAIVFVMVNMVVNAMYYNPGEEYETSTFLVLGPFRLSLKQLSISLMTALITTPSTFLIILIFKMSRRSTMKITNKELEKQYRAESQASSRSEKKVTFSTRIFGNTKSDDSSEPPVMYIEEQNRKCMLPSGFVYFGWFLALGGIIVPAFFVLVYSMQWGEQKSGEWLATFLVSLVQSILLIDPVKVAILAFFLAMIKKTLENSNYKNIDTQTVEGLTKSGDQCDELPRQQLTSTELKVAKEKSKVASRWNRIVLDLVFNMLFMWLLLSISYSNTNEESFHLHNAIVNSMTINASGDNEYKDISTTEAYYKWLRTVAIPRLFPEHYVNGAEMHWTIREYMDGLTSLRLGPPRLRQYRIRKEKCHLPKVDTTDCYRGYSLSREEDSDFCIGWGQQPCPSTDLSVNFTAASWKYTNLDTTDSIPVLGNIASYNGDGYFMTMDVNKNLSIDFIDELYENIWIDRNTRAVALEFTVYCANVNLFAYSLFLVEFPPSGGAFSMFSVFPARVYQHVGTFGNYIFFCEVVGLLFIVLLALQLVYALFSLKCKAFKKFWFLLDLIRLCILITTITLYFIRYKITSSAIETFQDNRRAFVDFYQVTFWNQLVIYMLGVSVFLSTLRVLKILEGNKNVYIISSVFSKMASDLFWFGVLFFYFIGVFAMLGFLLFGSRIRAYMNMYTSLRTLFVTIMGKNRFTEMNQSDPIFAKAYFFCFVCIISLMMFSIILSSLTQCIHRISQEYNQRMHKEDAFTYGFNKITAVFLRKHPKEADKNRVYPFRDINRRRDTLDTPRSDVDVFNSRNYSAMSVRSRKTVDTLEMDRINTPNQPM